MAIIILWFCLPIFVHTNTLLISNLEIFLRDFFVFMCVCALLFFWPLLYCFYRFLWIFLHFLLVLFVFVPSSFFSVSVLNIHGNHNGIFCNVLLFKYVCNVRIQYAWVREVVLLFMFFLISGRGLHSCQPNRTEQKRTELKEPVKR